MEKLEYFRSPAFISTVILAVGFYVVWIVIRHLFTRFRKTHAVTSAITALYSAVKYVLFIAAVLLILESNGINVDKIIAGVGIASLTIGLALQDALKDVFMGIHLMTEKFFEVGDVIRVGGETGVVISFSIRTTRLKDISNGAIITISNRDISQATVVSHLVDIDIPLPYEEDFRRVNEVLTGIAKKIAELPQVENCVYKGTQKFDSSAVIYKIRYFAPPQNYWDIWRAALAVVQEGLDEAGLHIPYNQLDVHQK